MGSRLHCGNLIACAIVLYLIIFTNKVVTVLLPLASVLLLVAARKDRCDATMRRSREMKLPPDTVAKLSIAVFLD